MADDSMCARACAQTSCAWVSTSTYLDGKKVLYYLDGKLVKTVTHDIATTPHRFTFQVAPVSPAAKSGQFLIDWVAIYERM